MTRARVAVVGTVVAAALTTALVLWHTWPGPATRGAFGEPVGELVFESDDLAGLEIPMRVVSFRRSWRTTSHATGLLAVPPGRREPMPAVLYLHGLGADASDFGAEALLMAARGVVTLCLDAADVRAPRPAMRGVRGLRADLALRRRTAADVKAALAQLASRKDVDPDRIALVGFSRGAATAALVAPRAGPLAVEVYVSGGAGLSTWPGRLGRVRRADLEAERRLRTAIDPVDDLARAPDRPRLVQLGGRDDVIARRDLERFARAMPRGAKVERYASAGHPLDFAALKRRLDWLSDQLDVEGPPVAGAATDPPPPAG